MGSSTVTTRAIPGAWSLVGLLPALRREGVARVVGDRAKGPSVAGDEHLAPQQLPVDLDAQLLPVGMLAHEGRRGANVFRKQKQTMVNRGHHHCGRVSAVQPSLIAIVHHAQIVEWAARGRQGGPVAALGVAMMRGAHRG